MNSYWVLWVAHAWTQKIIVRQQNHCKSVTSLTLTYRSKISDIDELIRHIISEWAALSHTVIAVRERRQRSCWRRTFWVHAEIKIVWCDTYDSDYFERQWLLCQSYLLLLGQSFKCTLNYCFDSSIWHFKFPKVVQAYTLGEVGILGTVLWRVSSGIIFPIFIEIGSYLTDRERQVSWRSFLRHGVDTCIGTYM